MFKNVQVEGGTALCLQEVSHGRCHVMHYHWENVHMPHQEKGNRLARLARLARLGPDSART